MPKEAYLKLTPTARSTWNKLDASSKTLILSAHKYKANRSPKPPCKNNESSNRFTLAELYLLLAPQYNTNDFDTTRKDVEEDSTCLVNFS